MPLKKSIYLCHSSSTGASLLHHHHLTFKLVYYTLKSGTVWHYSYSTIYFGTRFPARRQRGTWTRSFTSWCIRLSHLYNFYTKLMLTPALCSLVEVLWDLSCEPNNQPPVHLKGCLELLANQVWSGSSLVWTSSTSIIVRVLFTLYFPFWWLMEK